jgi:hypothetical protein
MSESFTAVEYAVLTHIKVEGRSTIPTIAADLLLRLSETEETLSHLISKGFVRKDGDAYLPGALTLEIPFVQVKKTSTGRLAPMSRPIAPAAAPAPPPMADVASVFRQARERSQREKFGGGV